MRLRVLGTVCICLMLATGYPALGADRVALVIGNADYSSDMLPALKNPTNDAALITSSLEATGFDVTTVMNADLRAMKRAIQEFASKLAKAGPDAIAAFYYSGHGFQANGLNYLAPLGAELRDEVDAEFEALSVDWVLGKLEQAHEGANLVMLDACRNTALSRSIGPASEGLALLRATPRGSFISFATAPGSTATDGKGLNSPYTAAIASEIRTPGLTVEAAFKNVRRAVVAASRGEQVPWDHSSLTSDIVFVPLDNAGSGSGGASNVGGDAIALELQLWNDVKDTGSAQQIEAYLEKYPQGAFAELAKARLEEAKGTAGGLSGAQVEQLFASLSSRALIIENPTRPHEYYSNARLHELQGDFLKARQDYLKYFAFGLEKVDPHYRFQAFLKAQEGRAGARETYASIAQGTRSPTLSFVTALLEERAGRIARLEAFIEAEPDFAPAYYELSRDYSAARLGQQSLADKKKEHALLTRFMELHESGDLLRYFIDQQMAARQIEDARERLAALSFLNQAALQNPVTLNSTRSNQGWMLSLSIADRTQEIFIAKPGEDFRSTGFVQGTLDPTTGKPMPYPAFELPSNATAMTLQVKYTDIRGETQGPFAVNFNPDGALVEGQKNILERFSTGWISFRDYDGKLLAYFTHLISYRCAIAEVRYGLDNETPGEVFPLDECDPQNPFAVTGDGKDPLIYISIPRATRFMTVKLTYKDGTQSELKRFDVPN